jgi:hypothetical protein
VTVRSRGQAFRRAGGLGANSADVPKVAAYSGEGEPADRCGLFPGAAEVGGEGQARLSRVWAPMMSQDHRSVACGGRIVGRVQPTVCLSRRKVYSRSKRRPGHAGETAGFQRGLLEHVDQQDGAPAGVDLGLGPA